MTKLRVGILVFPKVQQLDLTGPFEVFASVPEAEVRLVWKRVEPIVSATGLVLAPDLTFAECPQFHVLCVPGGMGVNPLMEDEEVLEFLRHQAEGARYVTSVCTGSLVLAAAGLLAGRRATTHWASHDFLARLGAVPVRARVVADGKFMTGGGVTAGIDMALRVVASCSVSRPPRRCSSTSNTRRSHPSRPASRRRHRPRSWRWCASAVGPVVPNERRSWADLRRVGEQLHQFEPKAVDIVWIASKPVLFER